MNLSTVALLLLGWYALSGNNRQQPQQNQKRNSPLENLSGFLSDDTKNILNCVNTLSSSNCSQEDRTSALFQMMTNPTVMNLAGNFFGGANGTGENQKDVHNETFNQAEQSDNDEHVNAEGYRYETPSTNSQEFFRPIDNIADTEVKHKLYWFYDNWYVK